MPLPHPFEECFLSSLLLANNSHKYAKEDLQSVVVKLLCSESLSEQTVEEMAGSFPVSWERHGDLVVLPSAPLSTNLWHTYLNGLSESQLSNFWHTISLSLKCKRLALSGTISDDNFRSPKVTLVLGEDGWVDHVDNGVHYTFDVTRCMFSAGNITEKIRVANFDCTRETVVDLYAGIGYFVLPYLVHAGAQLVHACEWNGDAVEGLRRGLRANGVEDRCIIHRGDNRKVHAC